MTTPTMTLMFFTHVGNRGFSILADRNSARYIQFDYPGGKRGRLAQVSIQESEELIEKARRGQLT